MRKRKASRHEPARYGVEETQIEVDALRLIRGERGELLRKDHERQASPAQTQAVAQHPLRARRQEVLDNVRHHIALLVEPRLRNSENSVTEPNFIC